MLQELKQLVDEVKSGEGAEILESLMKDGIAVLSQMMEYAQASEGLDKLTDGVAGMSKKMYDAFVGAGFSGEQAIRLTAAALGRK